jgi:hypothetical protein
MQEYTRKQRLDSQALATLSAARIDDCTATTGLHTNEKTVGAGAADFGGLVSAFHFGIPNRLSSGPPLLKTAVIGQIAPNTIRGTVDYGKFSQTGQDLTSGTHCSTVGCCCIAKLWIRF